LSFEPSALTAEALERVKKKKIGAFLRALNSPEYIANQFTRYAFHETSLFEVAKVLQSLTVDDVRKVADECFRESQLAVCQVVPKEKV